MRHLGALRILCTTAEHIFVLPELAALVIDNGLVHIFAEYPPLIFVMNYPLKCIWKCPSLQKLAVPLHLGTGSLPLSTSLI